MYKKNNINNNVFFLRRKPWSTFDAGSHVAHIRWSTDHCNNTIGGKAILMTDGRA